MNHEDAKADITVRLRHATHPASATALLVLEAVDEIAKLREALAPFAEFLRVAMEGFTPGYEGRTSPSKIMVGINNARLTLGDFQAARTALKS
jgi:hypothetical protein